MLDLCSRGNLGTLQSFFCRHTGVSGVLVSVRCASLDFIDVSRVFHMCFRGVPGVSIGCIRNVPAVMYKCYMDVV